MLGSEPGPETLMRKKYKYSILCMYVPPRVVLCTCMHISHTSMANHMPGLCGNWNIGQSDVPAFSIESVSLLGKPIHPKAKAIPVFKRHRYRPFRCLCMQEWRDGLSRPLRSLVPTWYWGIEDSAVCSGLASRYISLSVVNCHTQR